MRGNFDTVLYIEHPDGSIEERQLPTKNIVCPHCDGNGKHVNPSIDGNGLSDELRDDVEFMEDYMAGAYDVVCTNCDGDKVVPIVNEERLAPADLKLWYAQCQEELKTEREWAFERRMGA